MSTTRNEPASLVGGAWQLDLEQTTATFAVKTLWGLTTVHGRLPARSGSLSADGRITLTLDATRVRTGNPARDRHLRSSDFFATDEHPDVQFRSAQVSQRPDGRWQVSGELSAAGHRLQIDLAPVVRLQDGGLVVQASTVIDQHELGMRYARFGVRPPATLEVTAHLHAGHGHASGGRD